MATNNCINCKTQGVVRYDGAGTFAASAVTLDTVLVGGATNAIVSLALTDGQVLVGSTAAQPVPATLTAGAGIGITNDAGSITIASIGGGVGWIDATNAAYTIAVNTGYTANRGTLITFTLPAASVYGSMVEIVGKGLGLYTIAQGANQMVHFGSVTSTTGAGGSVSSILQYDCIRMVCSKADLEWTVLGAVGNFTIV